SGGGYCGWAPLPPQFGWQAGVGFRVGDVAFNFAIDRYIDPRAYTFVPERAFLDPVPRNVVPVYRNDVILQETRNVTDYRIVDSRPVNRGIAVERVQTVIGRPVPTARVVDVDSVAAARRRQAARDEVPVFRPTVHGSRERIATRGRAESEPHEGAIPRDLAKQRQGDAKRDEVRQRDLQRRQQAQARKHADERQQAEQREQAAKRRVSTRESRGMR